MTPNSLQHLSSSLQALPVAMVFSSQLLLTQTSSASARPEPVKRSQEPFTVRATTLTAILKNIPGYNHGGLNE